VSDYLGALHLRVYWYPSQKRVHEHKEKQGKTDSCKNYKNDESADEALTETPRQYLSAC
jgi:hypothetical protein